MDILCMCSHLIHTHHDMIHNYLVYFHILSIGMHILLNINRFQVNILQCILCICFVIHILRMIKHIDCICHLLYKIHQCSLCKVIGLLVLDNFDSSLDMVYIQHSWNYLSFSHNILGNIVYIGDRYSRYISCILMNMLNNLRLYH